MKKSLVVLSSIALLALVAYAAQVTFSFKTIHMGMIVSDLEKSLAFYKDVVGMVQVDRTNFDVDGEFGKRSGLTDGAAFHVEILKLGAGEASTQLKLMTFGDKAEKSSNAFIHSHTGVQYLTIMVDDIDAAIERVKKNNVKFCGETPVKHGENQMFVLIQDPDGTFVELIGPTKAK
jgi:catechol 2,3-dioxygenase-like lactoylglutathione lyase family enzyme